METFFESQLLIVRILVIGVFIVTIINTVFLIAISSILTRIIEGPIKGKPREEVPPEVKEPALLGLQDDRNGLEWGPHLSYKDEMLHRPQVPENVKVK